MKLIHKLACMLLITAWAAALPPAIYGQQPPGDPPLKGTVKAFNSLPFYEPWDQGTFSYQNWSFTPSQGNWAVNTTLGNPLPAAVFSGTPALLNYESRMASGVQPGVPWKCASMFMEFDVMLNDITASGTEKLSIEYYSDSTWFTLLELVNTGSTSWTHYKIEFSEVCGTYFRIGFRASGQNSAGIGGWLVDNILVHPECKPPTNTIYTRTGSQIHLQWQNPSCDSLQDLVGYNVYRTDETGNLPFWKINAPPVVGNEYTDNIPGSIIHGTFRYYISAIMREGLTGTFLCEAAGDTVTVDYAAGTNDLDPVSIRVFPQPAVGSVNIWATAPILSCRISDIPGKTVKETEFFEPGATALSVSLPVGIYLARITTSAGTFTRKITIVGQ